MVYYNLFLFTTYNCVVKPTKPTMKIENEFTRKTIVFGDDDLLEMFKRSVLKKKENTKQFNDFMTRLANEYLKDKYNYTTSIVRFNDDLTEIKAEVEYSVEHAKPIETESKVIRRPRAVKPQRDLSSKTSRDRRKYDGFYTQAEKILLKFKKLGRTVSFKDFYKEMLDIYPDLTRSRAKSYMSNSQLKRQAGLRGFSLDNDTEIFKL
jgi:hypothetical protein